MSDTQPLLIQVTETATQRVPDSIESIQDALPDVAEAAGAIDDTLRILDSFALDRQVFGIPLQFDLGIDYQPSMTLDETVLTLGESLDGVPGDLRALESDLVLASDNLALIGNNVGTIADDLALISETVDQINPLLDQYIEIVEQTQGLIAEAQADLEEQLAVLQVAVTALFVWLGLIQIVPIYLGWTLVTAGDESDEEEREKSRQAAPSEGMKGRDDDESGPVDLADGDDSEADEVS
jgi:hypothetical protein